MKQSTTGLRPTRGAQRNDQLASDDTAASSEMLLPSLDDGLTLLDIEGGRGVPVLQSLVLDHLLLHDGPAVWVDTDGYAATTGLARVAPSRRLLDRIHVARGFTAYQHYALVRRLPTLLGEFEQRSGPDGQSPSLVVVPAIDGRYRRDDTLAATHARTMLARSLATLQACASRFDVPVLVTRTQPDRFSEPVETAAAHSLQCEQTSMGPRFVGESFETLVYPVGDGTYAQTTLTYWRDVLDARARMVGMSPDSPADGTSEAGDVGTGVTADGTTATLTPDPAMDAWQHAASAGGR